ncbi:MAG TPA: cytochrome c3 family protein [Blastocatellia bacterium]|nr:cytochrome c3 family protein [Blastocatellia bacterium]HMV82642.1 cytochrome c3 family protein [Blastocatellia bacterium]HMX25098.1 cytochrome c3 family protein [Blastocatellia bacterium]HMY73323.1 cytochrome c3 family protein [Blastocatellia bacterium]HNG31931.1 cytochrome c3 family protein [Blastocatellia bacterium]
MPQLFHRSTNTLARLSIVVGLLVAGGGLMFVLEFNRTPYVTQAFVPREQPVQFSHRHHVGDDGIDCRYCHTTVETTASAGMPATKTCMNCHSQLFANSPYLEIVRASWRDGQPIKWTRVHDLPDFAYFNHSIHVNKGVGCASCHGRVDLMPLMWNVNSLHMEWCLECHRAPEKVLRPKDEITNMAWPENLDAKKYPNGWDQAKDGARLAKEYNIQPTNVLTSCSTCHR